MSKKRNVREKRALDCDRLCLQRFAVSSLEWLTRNLNFFSPWQDGRLSTTGVKAFAEFATVYGYLEEWGTGPLAEYLSLSEKLPAWRAFIRQHCENPVYAEMARKRPPQGFDLLLPYLMLRATGYQSPFYEDTLTRLRRWGFPEAFEVVPYRLLDRQHLLWKSGYLHREPDWYRLYQKTVLGCRCSLAYLDLDAAYSITHTMFYLTDFGNRPTPLKAVEVEYITEVVECLLVHYWRIGHWDLVGELLINLNCLGKCDSPFYAGAAQAFQHVWRSDGAVPADRSSEKKLQSSQILEKDDLIFRHCYHTTLVGVLYCSTALNHFGDHNEILPSESNEGRCSSTKVA
ncbi:hypothetical protein KFU94_01695 [Chloroflexi bacterium TSY]|nr:hypothetical protein [Chloroflexi bacterium TSY]